jgi:phenylalanyl-tRNA synthetase beta chain
VHPDRLAKVNIEKRVFYAQIDLHDLLTVRGGTRQMTPLPFYPSSDRDWTFTIREDVTYSQISAAISSIKSKLLKEVSLIDIYESETLGKGRKNITLHFLYRSDTATIEHSHVEKEHSRITEEISKQLVLC